ncbi:MULTISPECIES: NAD-dependent epimerase/dehydratase family protein [Psychrilyobacter]|uniref:NAD-dependent epimerase/dehydratase family protein n=1 Tax=Psychrilyobacter piezotolerans TaxID=2293438 RepID=A0ABX9KKW3_9FUSO|nr:MULTISPECIES: NAD-dependent epimerase/dehydratase family protein [Psychrilyobacter]MCS5420411.1 NAD-dependent epimerase/dehydratase family protein [Psychrilyobacter sp. S5]NDI76421.1 NAD-dependent epimerase/dehydratase family protein [Psychrilyobacter piezotolerans]RDE66017.1 NAD-dependent epimerase/dehydratase family protein [Psychrilyobacter sp. S5]REI43195.1 NAD-dependent epimerase/dehydratase family protein [Psychrilyobacter piezotolerans]
MQTLVIGGSGFIGVNLVNELLKSEKKIYIYDKVNDKKSKLSLLNITLIEGDLKDIKKLENIIKEYQIERIIHLASSLIPSSNEQDLELEMENVVNPTIKLINSLERLKIKEFIYFSSGGTVYGDYKENGIYKEIDSLNPINYYGWTKVLLENYIKLSSKSNNFNYLIIRPSNPYGMSINQLKHQGIIPIFIKKLVNNEKIEIWGDGSVIRDFITIEDLCRLSSNLILNKTIKNEVFNIGSGRGVSIKKIIEMIEEITNKKFEIIYKDSRLEDSKKMILDIQKIQKIQKIDLITLKEGITYIYETCVKESTLKYEK